MRAVVPGIAPLEWPVMNIQPNSTSSSPAPPLGLPRRSSSRALRGPSEQSIAKLPSLSPRSGTGLRARRMLPFFFAACVVVLGLAALLAVDRTLTRERASAERAALGAELSALRDRLAERLQESLGISSGVVALVAHEPGITQEEFEVAGPHLMHSHPDVRSISLARDSVVSHVFPFEENQRALGLDLATHADLSPAVSRAIELRQPVLGGPVDLIQGGRAVINRTPVFLRDRWGGGEDIYWGLATVLVDFERLLGSVDLFRMAEGKSGSFQVTILGRDARGASGGVILGDAQVLTRDPVYVDLALPGGTWRLAAVPNHGWSTAPDDALLFRLGAALIVLFLGVVTWIVVRSRQALQEEVEQHLVVKRQLLEKAIELERTLTEVKTLKGLIPICSHCKNIRDDEGMWNRLERYIEDHSHAMLSHGICPGCLHEHYGEELGAAVYGEMPGKRHKVLSR
jgi:sensor domain CHASE-containing protein